MPIKNDCWGNQASWVCKTCTYFVPKPITRLCNKESIIGRCRRHAPTMSGFPVMFLKDWCGDHKLDVESEPASEQVNVPEGGAYDRVAQELGAHMGQVEKDNVPAETPSSVLRAKE